MSFQNLPGETISEQLIRMKFSDLYTFSRHFNGHILNLIYSLITDTNSYLMSVELPSKEFHFPHVIQQCLQPVLRSLVPVNLAFKEPVSFSNFKCITKHTHTHSC